jgi:hypothetical protein
MLATEDFNVSESLKIWKKEKKWKQSSTQETSEKEKMEAEGTNAIKSFFILKCTVNAVNFHNTPTALCR